MWSKCLLKHFVTREGGSSTFLFRPTVLVKQVARVECVSEEVAINAFFAFLKDVGPNVVLVGVDEDTVGLDMPATLIMTLSRLAWLCKRWRQRTGQASGALLRATRGGRGSWNTQAWNISRKTLTPILQFVYFFYSKRPRVRAGDVSQQEISILSTSSIGHVLGSGRHAQVFFILFSHICHSSYVLRIPRDCVTEFAKKAFDVDSSWGRFINKVAVRSDVHPKIEKRETMFGSPEVLEVLNSFRTPLSIPIVRMEQVGF